MDSMSISYYTRGGNSLDIFSRRFTTYGRTHRSKQICIVNLMLLNRPGSAAFL
jgi:hypothetical protein